MAGPIRAQITDIVDPAGWGRVKVISPAMGNTWQAWALVLLPGPDAATPLYEPGDGVMIDFEEGDPDSPFVLGCVSWRLRPRAAQVMELPRTTDGWDNLVASATTRRALRQVVAKTAGGGAVLFSGPLGTGKTMAAQVIAKERGNALFQVDLARVVSKYIGETEKNLEAVFAHAEASEAVLLFDEADALFGKRSAVRDSSDRYANIEVSYLLQRIEAYRGLVILTTNGAQALDPALLRRLAATVRFPAPGKPPPRQKRAG